MCNQSPHPGRGDRKDREEEMRGGGVRRSPDEARDAAVC